MDAYQSIVQSFQQGLRVWISATCYFVIFVIPWATVMDQVDARVQNLSIFPPTDYKKYRAVCNKLIMMTDLCQS